MNNVTNIPVTASPAPRIAATRAPVYFDESDPFDEEFERYADDVEARIAVSQLLRERLALD